MELRRIASALAGGFVAEAVNKLVPLVIVHIVVTRIGAEAFGRAQFAYWLVDMAIALVVFGYTNVGAVEVAKAKGDRSVISRIASEILVLKLGHAALAVCGLLALVRGMPDYAPYAQIVTALSFLLVTSALDMSYVHIGGARMLSLSIINVAVKLGSLWCVLQFVRSPADSLLFALLTFGANGVIALANFGLNLRHLRLRLPKLKALATRFRTSLPFALTVFLMLCLERYDVFIAEQLLGPFGAGLYGAPVRIVQAFVHVVAAIGMVFFGEVAAKDDAASLTRLLNQGTWVTFALLMPMAVGVWFVGGPLLTAFVGQEYSQMQTVFGLLVLTLLGHALIVTYGMQVLMVQKSAILLNAILFGTTLLGITIAPKAAAAYGMTGVALATLCTRLLAGVGCAAAARKYVERYPVRDVIAAAVPAGGMALTLWIGRRGDLWWDLGLGAIAYAVLFIVFNAARFMRLREKSAAT